MAHVPQTGLGQGAAAHVAAGRVAHVYCFAWLDLGRHVYGVVLRLGVAEECALSTGITIGQCPGAARGVWPTVGLGMLEAASPRGCRGELVPRGSSDTIRDSGAVI